MNKWMMLIGAFIVWTAIWVVFIRPWLRTKPEAQWFFDAIEPIERMLWRKSESILWARTLQLTGMLLSFLTFVGSLDLRPLLALLPPEYQATGEKLLPLMPFAISLLGGINEFLRRDTTKPLSVVNVSEDASFEVRQAVADFEAAKARVTAVIEAHGGDGGDDGGDGGSV